MTYRITWSLIDLDNGPNLAPPDVVCTVLEGEEPWALANLAVRELENEMLARYPEIPEPDLSIPLLTEAWWQSLRKRRHAAHPIVLPSEPEPIPAKAVEVEDRDGDRWRRSTGKPHLWLMAVADGTTVCAPEQELIRQYGPVTVVLSASDVTA